MTVCDCTGRAGSSDLIWASSAVRRRWIDPGRLRRSRQLAWPPRRSGRRLSGGRLRPGPDGADRLPGVRDDLAWTLLVFGTHQSELK
jgi:hypothetical protein